MSVTAQMEEITPETAKAYIELNVENNRNVSQKNVDMLAQRMRDGLWRENGSAIRFDTEGRLIDGQHRLQAIVASGVPMRSLVVRGIEPDAFGTIDTAQKNRSASDYLKMVHGEFPYRTTIATIVTAVVRYERGGRGPRLTAGYMPTLEQINDRYVTDKDTFDTIAPIAATINNKFRLSPQVMGLVLYLFWKIDQDDTAGFVEGILTGSGLKDGDALLAFREAAIRELEKPVARRQASWIWGAMTIKTWNAFRQGKPITILRYRAGGYAPEDFPEPE